MQKCDALISEEHIDKNTALGIMTLFNGLQTLHQTEIHEKETQIRTLTHKLDMKSLEHQNVATLETLQRQVGELSNRDVLAKKETDALSERSAVMKKELDLLTTTLRQKLDETYAKITDRIVALENICARLSAAKKKRSFSGF